MMTGYGIIVVGAATPHSTAASVQRGTAAALDEHAPASRGAEGHDDDAAYCKHCGAQLREVAAAAAANRSRAASARASTPSARLDLDVGVVPRPMPILLNKIEQILRSHTGLLDGGGPPSLQKSRGGGVVDHQRVERVSRLELAVEDRGDARRVPVLPEALHLQNGSTWVVA